MLVIMMHNCIQGVAVWSMNIVSRNIFQIRFKCYRYVDLLTWSYMLQTGMLSWVLAGLEASCTNLPQISFFI